MGAFRFSALEAGGGKHEGTMEADSPRLVRQMLRDRGLHPIDVRAINGTTGHAGFIRNLRKELGAKERYLLTQQLATLLRSGLPLEEALRAIANQAETKSLENVVMDLRAQILEGRSLSDALSRYPKAFDELYRATVGAGEASGKLDAVLTGLVDHIARQQRLARKTQAALVYPIILTMVSILVVIGLLQFVVPEIVVVFEGTGKDLPGLTTGLIGISDFLQRWWPWLLGSLFVLVTSTRMLLSRPEPKAAWHRVLLKLPLISRFIRTLQTARLTRTLAILVGSGVPLLDSLKIAIGVLSMIPYREALSETANRVREGESLHKALEQTSRIPPITLSLIASGETGGNLNEMLHSAAEDQETEIEANTEIILSLFEPILILLMGGTVLIIVLAMLLPIFEMNQLVG